MSDFWLWAALLVLIPLLFLALPLLQRTRMAAESADTATPLNVVVYRERLAELQAQAQQGLLSPEQLASAELEAGRELLGDAQLRQFRGKRRGSWLLVLLLLGLPPVSLLLYGYWGASTEVSEAEAQSKAEAQATSPLDLMTRRLQELTQQQPDNPQLWFFLGRAYMTQQRPDQAVGAFQRALDLAGRTPELLGQLAQAQYFAGGKQWTPQVQALVDEALKANPQETASLGLLGIAAYEGGRYEEASRHWEKMLAAMPPADPARAELQKAVDQARQKLGLPPLPREPATASGPRLRARVDISAEVRQAAAPEDTVFVFAKVPAGSPMPLAVKRLRVADLPAQVELSDADAMLPQMKLSSTTEVILEARISRSGNVQEAQWAGQSSPLPTSTETEQPLLIESPVQP